MIESKKVLSAEQIEAMIQRHYDPSTHGLRSRLIESESEVELEAYLAAQDDAVEAA